LINPETFFTKAEQERIEQAVVAAESKTSGEIVPMVVAASARYTEAELTGVVFGMVIGTMMEFIWHDPWGPVHAYVLWPMVGAVLGYGFCSIPSIKRWLLSRERVADAIHLRSLAAFSGQGLHHTREHTGILIFVSLLEHRVVVLADRGIDQKVEPGTWQAVVDTVTGGLKKGNACDGFCKAIEQCGQILAAHFPRRTDDWDELPNKLITKSEQQK
jgi:putative membrane protein